MDSRQTFADAKIDALASRTARRRLTFTRHGDADADPLARCVRRFVRD
jgi:hypothetical protein